MFNAVLGHHNIKGLAEITLGLLFFRDKQGKHFTANFVIKAGGVACGLVAHSIE